MTRASLIAVALLGALPACGSAVPAATPDATTVLIKEFLFTPQSLQVAAGATVTWKNLDDEPHTVRSANGSIRSGALDQNDTFSVTFKHPGVYAYGCSIHPRMAGTIVVK